MDLQAKSQGERGMAELFDKVLRFVGSDRSAGVLCGEFNIAPAAAAKIAVGLATPAILANIERITYQAAGRLDWVDEPRRGRTGQPLSAKDFPAADLAPRLSGLSGEHAAQALVLGQVAMTEWFVWSRRGPRPPTAGADGMSCRPRRGSSPPSWPRLLTARGPWLSMSLVDVVRSENADLAAIGLGSVAPSHRRRSRRRHLGGADAGRRGVGLERARSYPPPVTGEGLAARPSR